MSRSEKRQRQNPFTIRLTPAEKAEMVSRASAAGFATVADFVRARCLHAAPLRARLDAALLVKVETALNRIGSNVNQWAMVANSTGRVAPDDLAKLNAALEHILAHVETLHPRRR